VTDPARAGLVVTPEVAANLITVAADAVRGGDLDTLERTLNAGVAATAVTPRGDSLLMLAAYHGRAEAVQVLLARGADPNQRDAKGQPPLAGVAFKGLIEIAELLVAGGADVNAASADGRTSLMLAAAFDRTRMVRWLLDRGASPDACDAAGMRAVDVAQAMGAAGAVAELSR
jgi:ankyrin repeat protein